MKQLEFLLDENISPLVKDHFESKGFKIEAVRDLMNRHKNRRPTQIICNNREKNPRTIIPSSESAELAFALSE